MEHTPSLIWSPQTHKQTHTVWFLLPHSSGWAGELIVFFLGLRGRGVNRAGLAPTLLCLFLFFFFKAYFHAYLPFSYLPKTSSRMVSANCNKTISTNCMNMMFDFTLKYLRGCACSVSQPFDVWHLGFQHSSWYTVGVAASLIPCLPQLYLALVVFWSHLNTQSVRYCNNLKAYAHVLTWKTCWHPSSCLNIYFGLMHKEGSFQSGISSANVWEEQRKYAFIWSEKGCVSVAFV